MLRSICLFLLTMIIPPGVASAEAGDTKVKPEVIYRQAGLTRRFSSPYLDDTYKDAVDQIYGSVRFSRTSEYIHEAVFEPIVRTQRDNPTAPPELLFEEAYIESQIANGLLLLAGKKAIYEGSGMMVNPSDLLNEDKDLFDELYQREGKVLTQFKYVSDPGTLSVAYVPRRSRLWRESMLWSTLSTDAAFNVDLRFQHSYTEHDNNTYGLSASRFFGSSLELHFDGRYQARQRDPLHSNDSQQQYLPWSSYERNDHSAYYLVGGRYIFSSGRTLILETVTQQSGLLPDGFESMYESFRDNRATEQTPTRLYGRHYAFVSYQDDDTFAKHHLGATYLLNTDDASSFVTLTAKLQLSDVSAVELTPTFFVGSRDTEFGEMPFAEAYYASFRGQF